MKQHVANYGKARGNMRALRTTRFRSPTPSLVIRLRLSGRWPLRTRSQAVAPGSARGHQRSRGNQ